jgi:hypothetical protein
LEKLDHTTVSPGQCAAAAATVVNLSDAGNLPGGTFTDACELTAAGVCATARGGGVIIKKTATPDRIVRKKSYARILRISHGQMMIYYR